MHKVRLARACALLLAVCLVLSAVPAFGVSAGAKQPSSKAPTPAPPVLKASPDAGPDSVAAAADDGFPGVPIPPSPVYDSLERYYDDQDVFSIELDAGEQLDLSLTGSNTSVDIDLYVYDQNYSSVAISTGVSYPETISYVAPVSGTYYVAPTLWVNTTGADSYTLEWAVSIPEPQLQLWAPSEGVAGDSIWLGGGFSAQGLPVPGQEIVFQRRPKGATRFSQIATGTTDQDGWVYLSQLPATSCVFRALTAYQGTTYTAESTFTLYPYLTVSAPASVRLSRAFSVSGVLRPKHAAGARTVKIACLLRGRVKKTVSATNYNFRQADGQLVTKYKASVALSAPGLWTLRAYVPGDNQHEGGAASRTIWVNRSSLSISYNGVDITYARSGTLTGYLKSRAGTPLAGRRVKLQKSYGGSYWTTVKTLTTSSRGKVSATVRPKESTYYRFYFAGDSKNTSSVSRSRWVYSCYSVREGWSSLTDGHWSSSVWLSKGKHRLSVYTKYGIEHPTIQTSTWFKLLGDKHVPPSTSRVYYVTVPEDGWYYLGWRGNKYYDNYIRHIIW